MSHELHRRTLGPLVRALYRMEIRGGEHVLAGPLIVTANHESMLDPFVLSAAIPRPLHYLAKQELWRIPLLSRWLDEMGAIPVSRGRGDLTALGAAREVLDRGEAIGLFPEGGVRREGPWLRGAARLALATGAPLLPVRLLGTAAALGPGRLGLPRVAVLIGEPLRVDAAPPTVATAKTLTLRLQASVLSLGT